MLAFASALAAAAPFVFVRIPIRSRYGTPTSSARAAARTFKAGWPSPRVAARDPYALRALVLIACIATFVAARGERWKRIAAAFDWKASCCRLVIPPRR